MNGTELQAKITALADELGVWWFHAPASFHVRKGFPDLVLIGTRGVLWRELKGTDDTLSPDQRQVGAMLRRAGQDWAYWYPADYRQGRVRRELEAIT